MTVTGPVMPVIGVVMPGGLRPWLVTILGIWVLQKYQQRNGVVI